MRTGRPHVSGLVYGPIFGRTYYSCRQLLLFIVLRAPSSEDVGATHLPEGHGAVAARVGAVPGDGGEAGVVEDPGRVRE